MPEISRFVGIIIAMFYNDHAPPRFHVRYGRQRALVEIATLAVLEGSLSPRVLGARSWNGRRGTPQDELHKNWELARGHAPLNRIEPLERALC